MILPTLDTRYKDDLDFLLIEDVTLFSYDLDYSWMDLVLRNRYWLNWLDLIDLRYISDMLLDFGILWLTLIEWECVIILIELEHEDLILCIKTCSISVIEIWIYRWLEDQSWSLDERIDCWFMGLVITVPDYLNKVWCLRFMRIAFEIMSWLHTLPGLFYSWQ